MKKHLLLVLACCLAVTLGAASSSGFAEIKLSTGEVLKDVSLLSQTPTHVTFKTPKGMRQVDKRQLPADLQERFPYDADAAERRKVTQAEAEAKRAVEREAKKTTAVGAKPATVTSSHDKLGVRITFSSDGEGSGPVITLTNTTGVEQQFPKSAVSARMTDDKILILKIVSRGEKLENGGAMTIVGDTLKVPAYGTMEFRGYFFGNYREQKHSVADVYWNN